MTEETNLYELPKNLPVPIDDGDCDHLVGKRLPDISLRSTVREEINLSQIKDLWVVIYFYPMIGVPGVALPNNWDQIPGARGCTPQSCLFRDLYGKFIQQNAVLYGVSVQSTPTQHESKTRLDLPFDLLSDPELKMGHFLKLPTFKVNSQEFFKRVTVVVKNGVIKKVFYPIFPPTKNPQEVLDWLQLVNTKV